MDGAALRLTASGGPSSGQCRTAPPPRHARRALDADRCAVCLQPVLFSASTPDLLLSRVALAPRALLAKTTVGPPVNPQSILAPVLYSCRL